MISRPAGTHSIADVLNLCCSNPALQRPGQREDGEQALSLPPGLRTPSTPDLLRASALPVASAQAQRSPSAAQQWQHMSYQVAVASSPPQHKQVARSLPPSFQPPAAEGCSNVLGGGSGGMAAPVQGSTGELSCLAAQLAPSLSFYSCSQVAAHNEAERQLSLLQRLKTSLETTSQPSASCCGSPPGVPAALGCGGAAQREMLQPPHSLPGGTALLAPTLGLAYLQSRQGAILFHLDIGAGRSHPHPAAGQLPAAFAVPHPMAAHAPAFPGNGLLVSSSMAASNCLESPACNAALCHAGSGVPLSPACNAGLCQAGSGALPVCRPPELSGGGLGMGRSSSLDHFDLDVMHSLMVDSDDCKCGRGQGLANLVGRAC